MTKIKKTEQQVEGESLIKKVFKMLTKNKYEIRSATMIDEMNGKGGKRITIFVREKDE